MANLSRKSRKTTTPVRHGERHIFGFLVASSSGRSNYKISFDAAPGAMYWVCSCPGCIRHGQCKHLTAAGLQGRKFGKQPLPQKAEGERAQRSGKALPAGS